MASSSSQTTDPWLHQALYLEWNEAFQPKPSDLGYTSPPLKGCTVWTRGPTTTHDERDGGGSSRRDKLDDLAQRLCGAVLNPQDHLVRLDKEVSDCLVLRFAPPVKSGDAESIIRHASDLLKRLAPTLPWYDHDYQITVKWRSYSTASIQAHPDIIPPLDLVHLASPLDLAVLSHTSNLVLRVALAVVADEESIRHNALHIKSLLDFIADMIDEASYDRGQILEVSIVSNFLAATWYRVAMLLFWGILKRQLKTGFDPSWDAVLAVKPHKLIPKTIDPHDLGHRENIYKYLCSWAFELLKTNRSSVAADFRHFLDCFARLHSNKPGRCRPEDPTFCGGFTPMDCGRFNDKKLVAPEQSVHSRHFYSDCYGGCRRIKWSEESYMKLAGHPRAVSVRDSWWGTKFAEAEGFTTEAKFTEVGSSTLAISHVWSHGLGGRPSTGMNDCLHWTFAELAQSLGCDSYWIDTLCIPEDHNLRSEAINFINPTFENAKAVLVLDRDLMDIDLGPEDTVETLSLDLLESLMATFLVCDWNVRAWTMLEAMKGCRNLHILCGGNKALSLRDCLSRLHAEGRVDLAVLFLALGYLIPPDRHHTGSPVRSLEVAGSALAYRHATRPGDDIVIWSLMTNAPPCDSPEEFWRRKCGTSILTAYLMSNTQRLKDTGGLSWAPATPYVREPREFNKFLGMRGFRVFNDGLGSEPAQITERGLRGRWLVHAVDAAQRWSLHNGPDISALVDAYRLVVYDGRLVCIIRPLEADSESAYKMKSTRGYEFTYPGDPVALVISDNGEEWRWQGVYSWPSSEPHMNMVCRDILIV